MLIRATWLVIVTCLLSSGSIFATEQENDILLLNNKEYPLLAVPLAAYLEKNNIDLRLSRFQCSANRRGYAAKWKIERKQLFLIGVYKPCTGGRKGSEIPISRVMPGQKYPIKASWYLGVLRIPLGKEVCRLPRGYQYRYEKEKYTTIINGRLVDEKIVVNSLDTLADGPCRSSMLRREHEKRRRAQRVKIRLVYIRALKEDLERCYNEKLLNPKKSMSCVDILEKIENF